jgi:hypothetical protein
MRSLAAACFFLISCGGQNKPGVSADAPRPIDAPKPIDSPMIDSPMIDAAVDAPVTAMGTHYHYVMDHEYVPTNNSQARAYGLDLNNDGTVDNQLGMVLGTLSSMGFDVQAQTTKSVDTGATLLLVDVQTTGFTNATGTGVTMYEGANPMPAPCSGPTDTVCRHHLAGTGTFDVATTSPRDTPLPGNASSGTFSSGPGHLPLQLAFTSTSPIELHLIGARMQMSSVTAGGIATGVVAGAVTQTEINTQVLPQFQAELTQIVYRDCCGLASSPGGATCNPSGTPPCGCVSGSSGATVIGLFDTSHDCKISLSEVQNNSLLMSLLAPDVTVEGQMALSLGVGFTAVPGTFTP